MSRTIHCIKLDQDLEGLDKPPYPGELGQRIYEQVSKQAWNDWLQHQTRLINEHRLQVFKPEARKFLEEQMGFYFFGGGEVAQAEGYVPE